jgi:hypothetical protein
VEKAFTRTTEEADELIALAKEKSKILTVFQNRRWVRSSGFFSLPRSFVPHFLAHIIIGTFLTPSGQ